jgi:hypothetical protein
MAANHGTTLTLLETDERVPLAEREAVDWAGTRLYRVPGGRGGTRWVAPAFRGYAAVVADTPDLPDPKDEDAAGAVVLRWVEQVRGHDWTPLRGTQLERDGDWIDLRTAMVRVGWGPRTAQRAWDACRERPYSRDLPSAAGWAGAGWVVPAAPGEPDPAFARPVLEARGLLRWAYIARWHTPPSVAGPPPTDLDPEDGPWADALARLRQDHYTAEGLEQAEQLALTVLARAGLGPRGDEEAEDEPLPDRDVQAACLHPAPAVRAAAWFLLRDEADAWLACTYGECQHHWAVEAEEDAFEEEEVLELAGHGVANPVDAAYQRRRLLEQAFGDVRDVPLAGAGDLENFISFYEDWVAAGRSEEQFEAAARALRGGNSKT